MRKMIERKLGRIMVSAVLGAAMILTNAMPSILSAGHAMKTVKAATYELENGDYYIIAEANKKVVCAENEGADPLMANRDGYGGAWEKITVVNNADGTVSFLSGANNKYVCAVIDESNQLLARSDKIDTWEKYEIVKVTDTQYAIKSIANGKYVKADISTNGGSKLVADSSKIQAWECFYFTKVDDGKQETEEKPSENAPADEEFPANGDYYLIAEANQKVICAENEGNDPLFANRNAYGGAWEKITVVNNTDGTVSFLSGANNKYVCAVIDDANQLVARSSKLDAWEKFELVKVNDTQYAIKALANGKYVKADINTNGGGKLVANSNQIQAWERFTFIRLDDGKENPSGNTPGGSDANEFKIIGYAPNWYGNNYLNNIDYSQVTNLIYAFAIPTTDGKILPLNDGGFMSALVKKAHENGVKVSIAIGGWSYNGTPLESTFAAATNTDAKCKTLANAMLKVVDDYDLDGIDVDWEYPRSNTAWQYETLIKYLREGLDQRGEDKILTSAVAGTMTTGYSRTALDYLDWVNVMAYDGDAGAGHSPYSYAVDSTNTWKNAGLPREKIMVGVPFYERPNWASYSQLVAADRNNAYKDKTSYNGATVYYNGLDTIAKKTEFACDNAGGIMIWEMSQDYTADKNLSLLNKIYETVNKNR